MEPKRLFASQVGVGASAQITSGPAAGKKWVVTTLYICNRGAITGTVTLTHGDGVTDYYLLNTASLQQGETVNVGSLVLENGDDIDATTVSVAMDFIAYGYEDDVV